MITIFCPGDQHVVCVCIKHAVYVSVCDAGMPFFCQCLCVMCVYVLPPYVLPPYVLPPYVLPPYVFVLVYLKVLVSLSCKCVLYIHCCG